MAYSVGRAMSVAPPGRGVPLRETSPLSRVSDALNSCCLREPEPSPTVDLPFECGVLRLVLGVTAPHKIQDVSADLLDLFQLSAAQCIGRTMGVLSGPQTNTQAFAELMQLVATGKRARAVLMLYSCSGAGERFCVSAQPWFSACGELTSALLELEPCKTLTLKTAALDDGRAKAIVEASQPFRAIFCSPEFEALYGLAEPMVLGRTLNLIHGPTTDQGEWRRMLAAAVDGTQGSARLVTSTSDCREIEVIVEVQPIVSAAGFITHLLIAFRQPPPPHLQPQQHAANAEYGLHPRTVDPSEWDMPTPAAIPDSKLPGEDELWSVPEHMAMPAVAPVPCSTWSAYPGQQIPGQQIDMMPQQIDMLPGHAGPELVPSARVHALEFPSARMQLPHGDDSMRQRLASGLPNLSMTPRAKPESSHFDFDVDFDPSYGMQRGRGQETLHGQHGHHTAHHCPAQYHAAHELQHHCGTISPQQTHETQPGQLELQHHCGARPPPARVQGVSTVVPRRKAGQTVSDAVASPVNITIETLQRYADVPLSKAATLLGISSTAMKKACRKLGVTRWPYTTTNVRPKPAPQPPKSAVTMHVDSAYVRKLFRKYSGHARIRDFFGEDCANALDRNGAVREVLPPHGDGGCSDASADVTASEAPTPSDVCALSSLSSTPQTPFSEHATLSPE